jgi:hypothetical protein
MISLLAFLGLAVIVCVGYWLVRQVILLHVHGVHHCQEIGELRQMLALLARHIDAATVDGLPVEVEAYLREMARGED